MFEKNNAMRTLDEAEMAKVSGGIVLGEITTRSKVEKPPKGEGHPGLSILLLDD